jgi:nitroreductase
VDYESLLELVKTRRSYRKIKPDPIPDEYVEKLIEVARWAPSGFNLQPWEFIVVKDPELIKRIGQAVFDYRFNDFYKFEATREDWQGVKWKLHHPDDARLSKAPVFIVLCGDKRTQVGLPMAVRYTTQKLESIWESTLATAFIYMSLAATTLGLGTHWVSAVKIPLVQCRIKSCLGIPDEFEVYDMLGVGYPDEEARLKLMRDKEEMIHHDYCGKDEFRTDEEVRNFIIKIRQGRFGSR